MSKQITSTNMENQFMELPLKGIKVIDYTGVQSGPACTQLMAWLGADVLKVERMHTGDNTRIQLRDIPNVDALYFTMVNSNKRSLEIDSKTLEGKAILEELIRRSDVMVENMAPGALDRQGFTWGISMSSTRACSSAWSRASPM